MRIELLDFVLTNILFVLNIKQISLASKIKYWLILIERIETVIYSTMLCVIHF